MDSDERGWGIKGVRCGSSAGRFWNCFAGCGKNPERCPARALDCGRVGDALGVE